MVREEQYVPDYLPFRCDLDMSRHDTDITVDDLLQVVAMFDSKTGEFIKIQILISSNYS